MNKSFILIAAALLSAVTMGAQSFSEGFLLKDYYRISSDNPAITPDHDYISIGEFRSNVRNNLGAAAFLYPYEGRVVTALHSSVSAQKFADGLKPVNAFDGGIKYNLVSYGIARGKNFHTFELNARAVYGVSVPYDIFKFAKLGSSETPLNLEAMGLGAKMYAELVYGYSRKIGDKLSIGARGKLLAGLYGADYSFNRFDIETGVDAYTATIEGNLNLTSTSYKIHPDENGILSLTNLKSKGKLGMPSGAGLALDFGVEYTPVENLVLAASITDLGGLLWYYGNAGASSGEISFAGVKDMAITDFNENGLKKITDDLKNQALEAIKLHSVQGKTKFEMLQYQVNAGVKYSMPFYKALTVGVTGRYMYNKYTPYWDSRFGIAVNPLSWLDVTGNIGYGAYGIVWGAGASVRVLRFRINAMMQNGFGGTLPYSSIPLLANNKVLTVGLTYDL